MSAEPFSFEKTCLENFRDLAPRIEHIEICRRVLSPSLGCIPVTAKAKLLTRSVEGDVLEFIVIWTHTHTYCIYIYMYCSAFDPLYCSDSILDQPRFSRGASKREHSQNCVVSWVVGLFRRWFSGNSMQTRKPRWVRYKTEKFQFIQLHLWLFSLLSRGRHPILACQFECSPCCRLKCVPPSPSNYFDISSLHARFLSISGHVLHHNLWT